MFFITGGLGFIGTNFLKKYYGTTKIINIDKISKVSNKHYSKSSKLNSYYFIKNDLKNSQFIFNILKKHSPLKIIHFAAESHVDRSIQNPNFFIDNNLTSTSKLLIALNKYFISLSDKDKKKFQFIYVSTDEVYGQLKLDDPSFREDDILKPSSPYSASKAASEMIVMSYMQTFNLPTIITRCSNNYGKYQFKEKLIPKTIHNLAKNKKIPIYGDGKNIRDWLHVDDHISAIIFLIKKQNLKGIYNIGSKNEISNLDLVKIIVNTFKKIKMKSDKIIFKDYINFVDDRLGHDRRYSINPSKLYRLGWRPKKNFKKEIINITKWYLDKFEY